MEKQVVKIGTRNSKLALWQANHVADLLDRGGLQPELVSMATKGDKILDVTLSKIGSKGVFTEELEEKLSNGEVDIAVHSAKDLPSSLPDGFSVLAFCEREEVEDVIVAHEEIDLNNPELVLGTSSTRRIALFKHYYPNIKTIDSRGNLQTRVAKLNNGTMHGLVLAYAGVHRMGMDPLVKYRMDTPRFVPPVGQGAVAIEINEQLDSDLAQQIKSLTNHDQTEQLVRVERAFLKTMDGGCSIPVFGLAKMVEEGQIELTGGIVSLDGETMIKRSIQGTSEEMGVSLAEEILESGGKEILEEIKSTI